MTGRLLVGVAQALEHNEPRQYVIDLVTGLGSLGVPVQVAMLRDGPVRADLEASAEVLVMEHLRPRSPAGVAESLARRASPELARPIRDLRTAKRRRWLKPADVVHLNGPQAVPLLRYVDGRQATVTTYVHPSDLGVAELAPVDRDLLIDCTDRYLAADEATAASLTCMEGIDPAAVMLAPKPLVFPQRPAPGRDRQTARHRVGLPRSGVVIGVPPVPDWMKAPDLTIGLAWEVARRFGAGAAHVLWFGGPPDERRRWPMEHDLRRVGLADTVHLVDPLPDDLDPLDLVDLVVLASRTSTPVDELFIKRAAARGVPVLAWSGLPAVEAALPWITGVVDQPDVASMASLVGGLVNDDVRAAAARRGRAALFDDIERIVPLELGPW